MTAKHMTVLVAEDAPDIRDILARLLQHNGYHVITTTNGQEALDSLQSERPDIILLDLSMPVLDGWKTLLAMRALPIGAETPIIAVTAHAMAGDREAILAHGFDAYISKPLNLRSLLEVVQRYCGMSL
jgi:two-component system, cell cycle response regulator DivK